MGQACRLLKHRSPPTFHQPGAAWRASGRIDRGVQRAHGPCPSTCAETSPGSRSTSTATSPARPRTRSPRCSRTPAPRSRSISPWPAANRAATGANSADQGRRNASADLRPRRWARSRCGLDWSIAAPSRPGRGTAREPDWGQGEQGRHRYTAGRRRLHHRLGLRRLPQQPRRPRTGLREQNAVGAFRIERAESPRWHIEHGRSKAVGGRSARRDRHRGDQASTAASPPAKQEARRSPTNTTPGLADRPWSGRKVRALAELGEMSSSNQPDKKHAKKARFLETSR